MTWLNEFMSGCESVATTLITLHLPSSSKYACNRKAIQMEHDEHLEPNTSDPNLTCNVRGSVVAE